nr:hypothetical protein [Tanacetum cinerariifolium]
MNEAVKTAVQLQSGRLRDEAQAENEDFINKLDGNIKKIIKEQVKVQVKEQVSNIFPRIEKLVNEQLEAEALTRSSNEAKTSHAVSANLSELELKKILIDKMKSNKSIHRLDQHKTLYKALIDAYETKKSYLIHMEIVSRLKDIEMMRMMTKNPSLDQTEGPREKDLEKNPIHPEFNTGFTEDQPVEEASQLPDWFQKLAKPSTPYLGPTFELMKGSCKSLVELEYFLKEVYKATTDQLDWNNPEGQQYPHYMHKPLPLIPNSQGHRVIPFDHFINNDLAYIRGGALSRTYATLVTKTKAADYGHIKWIEYLFSNTMWNPVPIIYDKPALWGISH